MSLRQFEYFVAVAEEGSLSRAAARLCVAQPSLSQQLKALERRVGGALFERLPRGMQLTPAGRAFLPEALATLRGAERAYRSARAAVTGESAELHIATVSSVAAGVLPTSSAAGTTSTHSARYGSKSSATATCWKNRSATAWATWPSDPGPAPGTAPSSPWGTRNS